MNTVCFTKTNHAGRILIAHLVVTIVCIMVPTSISHASAITDEWDEVFDTARAVLARLPDVDRIATLKDAGLREAVLRAYISLKSCAKVNKNQSRAVKQARVADFERAFKLVQTEAGRSDYQVCALKCKSDGGKCEADCTSTRKRLCSCKMTEFGCLVTSCLFR